MAAVALGACAAAPAAPPQVQPTPAGLLARCGADRMIGLIGSSIGNLPVQPAARPVRILRPGDAVTEEYSDRRLNVILDDKDRITALSCG